MTTYDSIILLGYSGVGKDTLANRLCKDYPGFTNVKFSALTKDLLSQAWRVPRSYLDGTDGEPKWREQSLVVGGQMVDVTPLDILVTLFHGALKHDKLVQANIKYALDNIPEGSTPIFTDVRREKEYQAIISAGWEPLVVDLWSPDVKPGLADSKIDKLAVEFPKISIRAERGQEQDTYERLVRELQILGLLKPQKPTLRVYIDISPLTNALPAYEPLQLVIDYLASVLCELGLPQRALFQRLSTLINTFVNEADMSKLKLPEITQNSYMVYQSAHSVMLPRLREMANLQLHIPKEGIGNHSLNFTSQEKSNAITY